MPKCLSTIVLHNPAGMLNGGGASSGRDCGRAWLYVAMSGRQEYACGVQVSGNHLSAVPVGKVIRHRQTDSPRQIRIYGI